MNRRTFLGSLGMVGTTSLGGCLDAALSLGSETKLARLSVVNWDETEGHTVDVRLTRDGAVVHESTYTVGKMTANEAQAAIADCTWDDAAGEYIVEARVTENTDWRTFDLLDAAEGSPDCVIAAVQYGRLSGINEDQPLNIEVRTRCDEVGEQYDGGCPAYTSTSSQ